MHTLFYCDLSAHGGIFLTTVSILTSRGSDAYTIRSVILFPGQCNKTANGEPGGKHDNQCGDAKQEDISLYKEK